MLYRGLLYFEQKSLINSAQWLIDCIDYRMECNPREDFYDPMDKEIAIKRVYEVCVKMNFQTDKESFLKEIR